jgi:hypothetical protein
MLRTVEAAVGKFPTPPRLYLQTVERIHASREDGTEGTSLLNTESETRRDSAEKRIE